MVRGGRHIASRIKAYIYIYTYIYIWQYMIICICQSIKLRVDVEAAQEVLGQGADLSRRAGALNGL